MEIPAPEHWGRTEACQACGAVWNWYPPYADDLFRSQVNELSPPEEVDKAFDELLDRMTPEEINDDSYMKNCEYDGAYYLVHAASCSYLHTVNSLSHNLSHPEENN